MPFKFRILNRKSKNFKLRISELINNGYTDKEICKIIYDEYSISYTEGQISSKRDNDFVSRSESQFHEIIERKIDLIKEALRDGSGRPKKTKEIRDYIQRKTDKKYSKKEINQILWHQLRDLVYHNERDFTYELLDKSISLGLKVEKKDDTSERQQIPEEFQKEIVFNELRFEEISTLINDFLSITKKNYIKVNSGNSKIDDLIKAIVKDNQITEAEEIFLQEKIKEFGLPPETLENAKKSLHYSNPYLDNLIHIIYDDGQITDEELVFLKEKVDEHNFSEEYVNTRFWQIGVIYYLNFLVKYGDFEKIIKLWHYLHSSQDESTDIEAWIFSDLNIFSYSSIETIISKGLMKLESEIFQKSKIQGSNIFIDSTNISNYYSSIDMNKFFEHEESSFHDMCHIKKFMKIIEEERMRLGTPDSNLLAENIKFRIENNI